MAFHLQVCLGNYPFRWFWSGVCWVWVDYWDVGSLSGACREPVESGHEPFTSLSHVPQHSLLELPF